MGVLAATTSATTYHNNSSSGSANVSTLSSSNDGNSSSDGSYTSTTTVTTVTETKRPHRDADGNDASDASSMVGSTTTTTTGENGDNGTTLFNDNDDTTKSSNIASLSFLNFIKAYPDITYSTPQAMAAAADNVVANAEYIARHNALYYEALKKRGEGGDSTVVLYNDSVANSSSTEGSGSSSSSSGNSSGGTPLFVPTYFVKLTSLSDKHPVASAEKAGMLNPYAGTDMPPYTPTTGVVGGGGGGGGSNTYSGSTMPPGYQRKKNCPSCLAPDLLLHGAPVVGSGGLETAPVAPSYVNHTRPPVLDWRNITRQLPTQNYLTNQGSCGSCYAVSSSEAVAYRVEIARQRLGLEPSSYTELSSQQIVDCMPSTPTLPGGCAGSNAVHAYEYLLSTGGLTTASNYPYQASVGTCQEQRAASVAEKIADYKLVRPGSVAQLEQALMDGPLVVAVAAEGSGWAQYGGGVFNGPCDGLLDHDVLLVGYTRDAWIIQNSWDASWGEKGFMRLSKSGTWTDPEGKPGVNTYPGQCGVTAFAVYPIVSSGKNPDVTSGALSGADMALVLGLCLGILLPIIFVLLFLLWHRGRRNGQHTTRQVVASTASPPAIPMYDTNHSYNPHHHRHMDYAVAIQPRQYSSSGLGHSCGVSVSSI